MTPGRNRLDHIVRGLDGVTVPVAKQWRCVEPDGPRTDWWPMEHDGHEVWKAWNAFAARNDNPAVIEYRDLYTEATVRHLEERLAKAAEALEPFANFDTEDFPDSMRAFEDDPDLTIGHFRCARTALSQIRSEK